MNEGFFNHPRLTRRKCKDMGARPDRNAGYVSGLHILFVSVQCRKGSVKRAAVCIREPCLLVGKLATRAGHFSIVRPLTCSSFIIWTRAFHSVVHARTHGLSAVSDTLHTSSRRALRGKYPIITVTIPLTNGGSNGDVKHLRIRFRTSSVEIEARNPDYDADSLSVFRVDIGLTLAWREKKKRSRGRA